MALRHKWKQRQKEQAAVLKAIADRLAPPKLWEWDSFATFKGPKRVFDLQQIERRIHDQINEACGIRGLRPDITIFDDIYGPAQQTSTPETPSPTGRSQGPGRDRWTLGAGGPHAFQPRRHR